MPEVPSEPEAVPPSAEVEVQRELTKRALIEAISSVATLVLVLVFALLRDRKTPNEAGDHEEPLSTPA